MECIKSLFTQELDTKIPVHRIFATLRRSPYGVRDGLMPLLLAAFSVAYQDCLAFYEKGSFLPIVEGEEFLRLTKAPDIFELQFCSMEGVRSELLNKLQDVVAAPSDSGQKLAVLNIVRSICLFVANLSEYSRHTKRISQEAIAIRGAVLSARDPVKLLFEELPNACGLDAFRKNKRSSRNNIDTFVKIIKSALAELRVAYPQLVERI